MWKSKHDAASAKKKKKVRNYQHPQEWRPGDGKGRKYTRNDRVSWNGKIWTCRKTHFAGEANRSPDHAFGFWKEEGPVNAE